MSTIRVREGDSCDIGSLIIEKPRYRWYYYYVESRLLISLSWKWKPIKDYEKKNIWKNNEWMQPFM